MECAKIRAFQRYERWREVCSEELREAYRKEPLMVGLEMGIAMVATLIAVRLAMAWFWRAPHALSVWH